MALQGKKRLLDALEGAQMIPNTWDHWGPVMCGRQLCVCVCACVIKSVSVRMKAEQWLSRLYFPPFVSLTALP